MEAKPSRECLIKHAERKVRNKTGDEAEKELYKNDECVLSAVCCGEYRRARLGLGTGE